MDIRLNRRAFSRGRGDGLLLESGDFIFLEAA
jgi:hypothetical protein